MTIDNPNTRRFAEFIVSMRTRELPSEVLDNARLCLADWLGVAMGAKDEPAAHVVYQASTEWRSTGRCTVLLGATAAAPVAALCNGTLAHCLDFDDTYVKGVTHISAPVWAATLALGEEVGASEEEMLRAYVAGFETAARAGYGLGELVTARGWHGTGVFGRIGAAASASVLLKLDTNAAIHALGAAATQASGLTASFGTMAKPFHAGKAAMDGVIAAQLAHKGFIAAENLLEPGGGLDNALIQDRSAALRPADFADWEILNNSFKPYAACHLTHPAIDAAKLARNKQPNISSAPSIKLYVGELAKQVTGEKSGAPHTPLEGKFDLKYCVALALHGHTLSAADFREPMRLDPSVAATASRIQVNADARYGFASAHLYADMGRAEPIGVEITVAKGHPGNALSWADMQDKFNGLLHFSDPKDCALLFSCVQGFGARAEVDVLRKAADIMRSA